MENTRVSSKGQMIIPKRVRETFGPNKATDLMSQVISVAGMLAHRGKRMSRMRERAAIMAAVLAEDERTKRKARRRP